MSSFVPAPQYSTEHSYVHASQGFRPQQYVFNVTVSPYPGVAPLAPEFSDTPSPSSSSQSDASTFATGSSRKIPRPLNCYFIFRKDVIDKKLIPKGTEHDSRHLSRIIGELWRKLSEEEKNEYYRRAEVEKEAHQKLYPDYAYHPQKRTTPPKKRNTKRNTQADITRSKDIAVLLHTGKTGSELEEAVRKMSSIAATPQTQVKVKPPKKKRASRKSAPSPPPVQHSTTGSQGWKTEALTHQFNAPIPSMGSDTNTLFAASFESQYSMPPEFDDGLFGFPSPASELMGSSILLLCLQISTTTLTTSMAMAHLTTVIFDYVWT
ncbi:uncharacterized protein EV420DRAFT_902192 [Desarmillaria tabescens]|uniref:HMG box domain-containing protein n=1 Tax=Armillaria tabescens TaxID=1929756 RepID=A0AA39MU86_ARMTA|nr:uncharacterized protein EV420DRAFT_902192 [Desarmillaria tabescens]KAK0446418.1 hypothetical protein EV420DRAFT_902192 [Desarmillaria tabescens]